jgi:hypothetical protein
MGAHLNVLLDGYLPGSCACEEVDPRRLIDEAAEAALVDAADHFMGAGRHTLGAPHGANAAYEHNRRPHRQGRGRRGAVRVGAYQSQSPGLVPRCPWTALLLRTESHPPVMAEVTTDAD